MMIMMTIVFIKAINRQTVVDTTVWAVRVRNYSKAHIRTPQKSYVKYTKNRYYLPTKNISTFSNIAIIN